MIGHKKIWLESKNLAGSDSWWPKFWYPTREFSWKARMVWSKEKGNNTRDKHLLVSLGVSESYVAHILNSEWSLQLVCQKAFRRGKPEEAYTKLSKRAIQCARGIPLALKVLETRNF
jgi:hypothetical protein